MRNKKGYIYIMTNKKNGVLYTGVTSDLVRRVKEHKSFKRESFTKKYNLNKLVYYDFTDSIIAAIGEEKRIKAGSRKAKIKLIESMNPGWNDLYEGFFE